MTFIYRLINTAQTTKIPDTPLSWNDRNVALQQIFKKVNKNITFIYVFIYVTK